jgi:hypothetical protein
MKHHIVVAAVVAFAAACSSAHSVAVHAGDRCFRCHRVIGDARLGAAIVDPDGRAFTFRTAGCLAKYLKDHPTDTAGTNYVTDHGSGRMFPADRAYFVATVVESEGGMVKEPDYMAFEYRNDAQAAAPGAALLRWDAVILAVS